MISYQFHYKFIIIVSLAIFIEFDNKSITLRVGLALTKPGY